MRWAAAQVIDGEQTISGAADWRSALSIRARSSAGVIPTVDERRRALLTRSRNEWRRLGQRLGDGVDLPPAPG
jgi:hypothetical protein